MVIENPIAAVNAAGGANGNNNAAHPSGIPQDKIDNIMSGIANTGDVKMNNHRKKLRQRFDIIKKLGQGTYGKVQLGINKETGQEVAIKTIKKCKIEAEADLVRIRREVQIMSSVQHPNIIHIYEVFENREKMVLVMEFAAGGELYDYLSERKVLSEEEARRIFRQVATAVYYCHKHKICHRDLKLENILLDEHGNAKIADFGLSNVFDDQHLLGTFCGSPLYASPEIVEGTPYWGPEVDCWSLGVLLYTLVYGSMPFDGSNFKRLVKQISQGDYYEPKKPSRASSLIREMLTVCPQKRASIEQICSHWWVNENDNVSCLELAENLANQTPVRLDVLLSLTPAAVVAEQLVVPSADGSVAGKGTNAAMPRSHSVGSIRDLSAANATTEAEQRILDMVAAGGEAALMPSPTRTITPAQSPVQTKRKLETTISTDNAALALKKKEKAGNNSSFVINESTMPLNENEPMDTDDAIVEEPVTPAAAVQHTSSGNFSEKDMELINDMCAKLINRDTDKPEAKPTTTDVTSTSNRAGVGAGTGTGTGTGPVANTTRQKTVGKLDAVEETPEEKEAAKVINKFVNKQKTADLVNAVEQTIPTTTTTNEKVTETTKKTPMTTTTPATTTTTAAAKTTAQKPSKISPSLQVPPPIPFVRKCSLQDESTLNKFNGERRKSRILETAEKFQQMNAQAAPQQGSSPLNEKPKKIVIPGVSVGSFKKEFERKGSKAAGQQQGPTLGEKRAQEQAAAAAADAAEREISPEAPAGGAQQNAPPTTNAVQPSTSADIESSDSKNSVHSLSLDDARRSMENSIALLRQAQNETATKDVDQLCAKTESIGVSEPPTTKLNIAAADRERKLQSARAIIGSAITPASPPADPNNGTVKTSTASITLKSATLPRRKTTAKTEIQLDIKPPRIVEQEPAMRFTTEMQHPIADVRSAPARDGPMPFSPVKQTLSTRAASLEPKEHIIHVQRPPQVAYSRTTSNSTNRSGSLSRQSTNDSESDTTTNLSQSTMTASSQPIKKSPREFIIPIAVEGGGFITPREGSIEPSESSHTTSSRSTFNRFNQRPARRIGSLLSDSGVDETVGQFQKMRTASTTHDGDEDGHFTLHKLRSTRPVKKASQDNDSNSSGEEDDDDGFEILTAENLFSTLLQRVRALTNRLNVNNDLTSGFPNSCRLLTSMRHDRGPFWNQEPFTSRLNKTPSSANKTSTTSIGAGAPWRHSLSRDLSSDMESMFSRTGATLPRGSSKSGIRASQRRNHEQQTPLTIGANKSNQTSLDEPLDLADLDLSRLRLSKKDLETLSSIAPGLPKCFQEQLLAKLPPTQARKLSRTLSMQNDPQTSKVKVCKRSQSGGRNTIPSGSTNIVERCAALPEECESSPSKAMSHKNAESFNDQNARNPSSSSQLLNRRSITRMRNEYESGIPTPMSLETSTVGNSSARKSRSNSVCRDDYSKSLCSPYTSEISDKYKYYSPYLSKSAREPVTTTTSSTESGSVSPYKQRYSSVSPRESTIGSVVGRPPSGCLSPPLATGGDVGNSSSLRGRTTQRRISRFLRPDFYEELPITSDDTPYQREKKLRERETQNVLREIRQKSRESSRERVLDHNDGNAAHVMRKHSVAGTEAELLPTTKTDYHRHVRNKSVELFNDLDSKAVHATSVSPTKRNRRSLSRSRNTNEELDTHALADKILQELQLLSAMRSEQDNEKLPVPREVSLERTTETTTVGVTDKDEPVSEQKTVTVKKVKKLKPKDKIVDSAVEPTDNKLTTTTVVKKVKKIVKKADNTKTPTSELPMAVDAQSVEKNNGGEIRKESKLKRPKSYPTKEQESRSEILSKVQAQPVIPEVVCDAATCPQMQQCAANTVDTMPRESRLMRPKSYPVSKIAPPKEVKKVVTRSGAAISSISESNSSAAETTSKSATLSRQSTSEEKSQSQSATPTGKSSVDTSSSSESRPTIKKVIKVTKKSKLMQPTPITPTTPPTTTIATPANETTKEWKEKSPEKKPNKGLLYAIGQKFEKFRDSAMNKEKRAQLNANSNSSSAISVATAKENNTSEKVEKKTSLLKKKKSLDGAMTPTLKTEKTAKTIVSDENKTNKKPNGNAGETGKTQLKAEKRSRLDAMIRSIRERSVPRAQPVNADSNYIKRALSVEEIPSTQSNKNAMNRVLGLFKRSEKEGSTDRRVRSTRSTSNLERQLSDNAEVASPIYQNTKEAREAAKVEHALANERYECDSLCANNIAQEMLTCPDCIAQSKVVDAVIKRREARANMTPKSKAESTPAPVNKTSEITPQGNKDKRRGLMLDLVKIDNVSSYPNNSSNASTTTTATRNSKACYINGNAGSSISNGIYSNLPPYPYTMPPHSLSNPSSSQHSMDNNTNNNSCMTNNNNNNNNSSSMQTSQTSGYRTSSTHEINRNNLLTPSNENIENYSSDCSRSIQDDCASTSTFLSPTDEPELYFDNWSICSEDNYMVHATPSPTVSRLSRTSQLSSPTRGSAHGGGGGGGGGGGDSSDPNESVIDRIKRRSFYTRFNEKKPKRTSSIVGPTAVRDYYREQKAAIRSARAANKPSTTNNTERNKSPDITQEFLRPLKLSPVGTELKPPVYKSPYSDYTHTPPSTMLKPRKSLNDIRTSASPSYLASKHRYATNADQKNDYLSVPSSTSAASRYKSSSSSSPYDAGSSNIGGTGSSYYSTYNPKRRSSYTLNGLLPNGASSATSNIDSYATLGRRTIRPYDQRTLSLLDPTTTNSTSFRRETRTPVRDYATSNISRSNSRYRVSSTPRSPTNI